MPANFNVLYSIIGSTYIHFARCHPRRCLRGCFSCSVFSTRRSTCLSYSRLVRVRRRRAPRVKARPRRRARRCATKALSSASWTASSIKRSCTCSSHTLSARCCRVPSNNSVHAYSKSYLNQLFVSNIFLHNMYCTHTTIIEFAFSVTWSE